MKYLNLQKGIAPIILILILAVVAAGGFGGAQYFKKQQAKQVAKSSVVDATANWKTYVYKNMSLRYPSDWTVVFDSLVAGQPNGFSLHIQKKNATGYQPDGLTLSTFNDRSGSNNDYIISQNRAFVSTDKNFLIQFAVDSIPIYAGCSANQDQAAIEICNQILSTFKFTDKYQTVDLKDVLKYSDSHEKNSFVKTSGKIVNLAYGNFRDFNIVLSDRNNNYILVTISHPDVVSTFSDIIATLNKDDKIEVNGLAIFTSREALFNATEIGAGKNLLSVNQNLPDRIGAITVTGTIQKLK